MMRWDDEWIEILIKCGIILAVLVVSIVFVIVALRDTDDTTIQSNAFDTATVSSGWDTVMESVGVEFKIERDSETGLPELISVRVYYDNQGVLCSDMYSVQKDY